MPIRLGYDIQFDIYSPASAVTILNVHPSRVADLRESDESHVEPSVDVTGFIDSFGNRCSRFVAPPSLLRLNNLTVIHDSGAPDSVKPDAREVPIQELPNDVTIVRGLLMFCCLAHNGIFVHLASWGCAYADPPGI
jgi:hypothetical protein